MTDSYISVSQVNSYIKNIFDAEIMLQNICVYGEIGSFNISGNNAYFNLKDENGMLSCVLFGISNFDLPKIGDMVLVRGSMSYYAKGGRLSFNAFSIMHYGKGLLYEKFLKLKAELEMRGYFEQSIKKQIPKYIKRIGVVTSPTGAVIKDIIDVTHRRNNSIDIVLYPVKVQGVGADKEIATGIEFFSQYDKIDVVIVARGGGSMEDLEPFNSEIVANAVYNCKKPIVSAVGHETDFTIIDFVADLRAPTPSAAAELVAWDKKNAKDNILSLVDYNEKLLLTRVKDCSKDIELNLQSFNNSIKEKVFDFSTMLDEFVYRMSNINSLVDKKISDVEKLNLTLNNYNPQKISNMGYSKIIKDTKVITNICNLKTDDIVTISMIDGSTSAKICKG